MTERPSPERLAEIRAWMRRQDGAQAPFPWRADVTDLLAEIDALRAEAIDRRKLLSSVLDERDRMHDERLCDCGKPRAPGRCAGNCDRDD